MISNNVSSADNQQERLKLIGWIVGFTDGEGCFCVSINRNNKTKLGWQVMPEFVITQGEKSVNTLEEIKKFFNCGRIFVNRRHDNHKENLFRYCVRNIRELNEIIIPFFTENKLKSWKKFSFNKFSQIVNLMIKERTHLNLEGIKKIAQISSQINQQKISKFLESSETIRRESI
jgi:hypothetical protein